MRNLLASTAIVLCLSGGFNVPVALGQENTEVSHPQTISDEQAHTIVLEGTPEEVKKLAQGGYNVNKVYYCNTLLNTAIKSATLGKNALDYPNHAIEKIKILIESGADVNKAPCPGKVMLPAAWAVISPLQLLQTEQNINQAVDQKIQKGTEYCDWEGLVSKPCKDITQEEKKIIKRYFHKTFRDANKFLMPYFMEITRYLIENGANINGADIQNQSLLHHAVMIPQEITTEPAMYLIEKGADVNARDIHGQTPLFFAYGAGNDKLVKMLIDAGADLNVRNNVGIRYNQVKAITKHDTLMDNGSIKEELIEIKNEE